MKNAWTLPATAVFLGLVICSLARAEEVKQELRLTAAEIWARSSSRNVKLSADGKSIELLPGKLIEDDGAAAGFSYKPNEEVLSAGVPVVKILKVDLPKWPPPRAWLLVGHTGKELNAKINQEFVDLPAPTKAGNYWKRYEIPARVLKPGNNEIALTGDGKLWIARRDDDRDQDLLRISAASRPLHLPSEQQSFKLGRDGNRSIKLGPNYGIEGEYCVRLLLDGYLDRFRHRESLGNSIRFTIVDAANLTGQGTAPQNARIKGLRIIPAGDWPGEFGPWITVHTRFPPEVHQGRGEGTAGSEFVYPNENPPRSFDIEISLAGNSGDTSSRLHGVRVISEFEISESPETLKITTQHNPQLLPDDFKFEDLAHPRLAEFRKQYNLDEVVKDCTTDLQRMEKLAVWTSQQWTKGHLGKIYPKWDALEILKKHEDGTPVGGFCQQYNIVFLQACESFGMPGRCVSIGAGDHGVKIRSGHEVVEIWSNELNKWVYVDGQAAWYFVDKETGTPLNLLELRERQLAVLLERPDTSGLRHDARRPVEVVVLAKSPYEWKGLQEWPAFAELRMIPHTQFLDGKLPLPLNQGMRGWFWTGHRVWTDELYPGSVLYKDFVTSPHAWNWPINQTHLELQQAATSGELTVNCTHNMPSFAKFAVQIDDQSEKTIDKSTFTWPLHAGENRVQVRAVNSHGLRGPVSWIKVSQ